MIAAGPHDPAALATCRQTALDPHTWASHVHHDLHRWAVDAPTDKEQTDG